MATRAARASVDMRRHQHRCADYSVELCIASSAFNSGSLVAPRILGGVAVHYGPGHPLNRTEIFYPDTEGYLPENSAIEPRTGLIARRALLHGLLSALVSTKDIYRVGRASTCLHINTSSSYLDTLWNEWLPDWEANGWPRQEPQTVNDNIDVSSVMSSEHSQPQHASATGSLRGSIRGDKGLKRLSVTPSITGSLRSNVSDAGLIFDTGSGKLVNEDLLRKVAVFRRNFFVNEKQTAQGGSVVVRPVPFRDNTADRIVKDAVKAAAFDLSAQVSLAGEPRRSKSGRASLDVSKRGSTVSTDSVPKSDDRIRSFSRSNKSPIEPSPVRQKSRSKLAGSASAEDPYTVIPEEPTPPSPVSSPVPQSPARRQPTQTTKGRKEALAATGIAGALGGAALAKSKSRETERSVRIESPAEPEPPLPEPAPALLAENSEPLVPARKSRRIKSRSQIVEKPRSEILSEPADDVAVAEPISSSGATGVVEEQPAEIVEQPKELSKKAKLAKSPKKAVLSKREKSKTVKAKRQEALSNEEETLDEPPAIPVAIVTGSTPAAAANGSAKSNVAVVEPPPRLAQTRAGSRMSVRSGRSGLGTDTENEVFDDARSGYGDIDDPESVGMALTTDEAHGSSQDVKYASAANRSSDKSVDEANDAKAEDEPSFLSRMAGGAAAVIGLGGGAAAIAESKKNDTAAESAQAKRPAAAPSRRSFAEEINDAFDDIGRDAEDPSAKAEQPANDANSSPKRLMRKKAPKNIALPKKADASAVPTKKSVDAPLKRSADSTLSPKATGSGASTPFEKKKPVHPLHRDGKSKTRSFSQVDVNAGRDIERRSGSAARSPDIVEDEQEEDVYPRAMHRHNRITRVRPGNATDNAAISAPLEPARQDELAPPTKSRSRIFSLRRKKKNTTNPISSPEDVPMSPPLRRDDVSPAAIEESRPAPDRLVDYRSPEQSRIRTFARQKQQERERAQQMMESSGSSGPDAARAEELEKPVSRSAEKAAAPAKTKRRFSFFQRLTSRGG